MIRVLFTFIPAFISAACQDICVSYACGLTAGAILFIGRDS